MLSTTVLDVKMKVLLLVQMEKEVTALTRELVVEIVGRELCIRIWYLGISLVLTVVHTMEIVARACHITASAHIHRVVGSVF
jgi:hypothetical protein